MAEVTGLRNNALPYPVYGLPWGVVFPMLDADGDLVTGATTPDAEVSKNGDTFADCTNESTEIATSSGVYYLLLTGTEMTADVVAVIAKSATAGMKTTVLTFYPRKLVSIRAGTSVSGGVSTSTIVLDGSASAVDDFYNGMICAAVIDGTTEVRMITDYTGSNQTATVTPDWNTAPDNNDTFTVYLPDGVQIQQANTTQINGVTQATPGASGGILISGNNSGTTTLGALTVSGATTLAALSCTTLTASGAVAFQSTFAVTTSTSLGALSCTTLTASGAVAFQSTFAVTTSTSLAALSATTITASGTTSLAAVTTSGTVTFNAFTVTNALTAGTNAVPWNASWDAEVQSEVQDAIEVNHLDHLLAVAAAGTEAVNSSYWSRLVSKSATPAFSSFDNTTDSLEALRDRGDAAWITATGFSTHTAADVWAVGTRTLTALGFTLAASDLSADTITAAKISADAGTEIGTAVWASATRTLTSLSGLTVDTVTTLTNLPAITANWLTAAGLATDAVTEIVTAVLTTQMTEAYAADGVAPTLAQALFLTMQSLHEFSISSTTRTVKKLDGSTTAATFTLDHATSPTSTTRAT